MLGDKMQVMFWDMPTDGKTWTTTLEGTGEVTVRYFDKRTGVRGSIVIPADSDTLFIKKVLTLLGFSENPRGVEVR